MLRLCHDHLPSFGGYVMVHVIERAKEVLLQKKVSAKIHDARVGLRFAIEASGQLTLVADRAKAGDEVVTHRDSTVFVVDPEVSAFVLAGRTVDCWAAKDGRLEFILRSSGFEGQDPGGEAK
jgi:hypothetical protein